MRPPAGNGMITGMTAGEAFQTEERAKAAARKDLAPFVVELPDAAGYAWFAAGTAWFGPDAEVPPGSRVLARWDWVKDVVTGPDGRRRFERRGRKGWKDVRFGESIPGLR